MGLQDRGGGSELRGTGLRHSFHRCWARGVGLPVPVDSVEAGEIKPSSQV